MSIEAIQLKFHASFKEIAQLKKKNEVESIYRCHCLEGDFTNETKQLYLIVCLH